MSAISNIGGGFSNLYNALFGSPGQAGGATAPPVPQFKPGDPAPQGGGHEAMMAWLRAQPVVRQQQGPINYPTMRNGQQAPLNQLAQIKDDATYQQVANRDPLYQQSIVDQFKPASTNANQGGMAATPTPPASPMQSPTLQAMAAGSQAPYGYGQVRQQLQDTQKYIADELGKNAPSPLLYGQSLTPADLGVGPRGAADTPGHRTMAQFFIQNNPQAFQQEQQKALQRQALSQALGMAPTLAGLERADLQYNPQRYLAMQQRAMLQQAAAAELSKHPELGPENAMRVASENVGAISDLMAGKKPAASGTAQSGGAGTLSQGQKNLLVDTMLKTADFSDPGDLAKKLAGQDQLVNQAMPDLVNAASLGGKFGTSADQWIHRANRELLDRMMLSGVNDLQGFHAQTGHWDQPTITDPSGVSHWYGGLDQPGAFRLRNTAWTQSGRGQALAEANALAGMIRQVIKKRSNAQPQPATAP